MHLTEGHNPKAQKGAFVVYNIGPLKLSAVAGLLYIILTASPDGLNGTKNSSSGMHAIISTCHSHRYVAAIRTLHWAVQWYARHVSTVLDPPKFNVTVVNMRF